MRLPVSMALPDQIEIVPLGPLEEARINVPGSKSITNRALIQAALRQGPTRLESALWSEDTQVMCDCLDRLGFRVDIAPDPNEVCNRIITIEGQGGLIPNAGTIAQPLDLFVGNAGTAARFLAAMVCLGHGAYRLTGVRRMHERPQAALFSALRQLGYTVDSTREHLPAIIHGTGPRPGSCQVSIEKSSQFASALLLCSKAGGWTVAISGENSDESSYVSMTSQLAAQFAAADSTRSFTFQIEPDASSASYLWGASWLADPGRFPSALHIAGWEQMSNWQIDARFPNCLPLPPLLSRKTDLADSIMTAIVLAPFGSAPVCFTDLGRLRLQECERVTALRTELLKCGARIEERGDTLEIRPGPLHDATINTYNDHRMAMCFATLALKVPGLKLNNPACVKKTFPNFFQKLAAPPPHGLGVTILDCRTGQPLRLDHLFAE